jgi:hypothetical protein
MNPQSFVLFYLPFVIAGGALAATGIHSFRRQRLRRKEAEKEAMDKYYETQAIEKGAREALAATLAREPAARPPIGQQSQER